MDRQMRFINFQMLLLSMAGLGLMIFCNEICFNHSQFRFKNSMGQCPSGVGIVLAELVLFVLFSFRLVAFYQVKAEEKRYTWNFDSRKSAFLHSTLKWWFLAELVANAILPTVFYPDGWDVVYKMVCIAMFARFYLVVRAFKFQTHIYRERCVLTAVIL